MMSSKDIEKITFGLPLGVFKDSRTRTRGRYQEAQNHQQLRYFPCFVAALGWLALMTETSGRLTVDF